MKYIKLFENFKFETSKDNENYSWLYFFQELIDDFNLKITTLPDIRDMYNNSNINFEYDLFEVRGDIDVKYFRYDSAYPTDNSKLSILGELENDFYLLINKVVELGGQIFIDKIRNFQDDNVIWVFITKNIIKL